MCAWRVRPSPVQQGPLTCWAAAISSFSRVTTGVPNWSTVGDVIAHFKASYPGSINADGTLKTPSGWKTFADDLGLRIQEIRLINPLTGLAGTPSSGISSTPALDLTREHFVTKLHRSHVITVIGVKGTTSPSHTVVVYGADRFRLCFMNPLADPSTALTSPRPAGGSGRVAQNWFCETYQDFATGPRYLLVWR